jgi:uncharacterized small protein (DUF1192 family)
MARVTVAQLEERLAAKDAEIARLNALLLQGRERAARLEVALDLARLIVVDALDEKG